jgi:hypothetical protein
MLGKATNFYPGGALCHYTELLTFMQRPVIWGSAVQTLEGSGQAGSRVPDQFIGGPKGCNFAKSNKSAEERGDFGGCASRRRRREQV